MDGNLGTEFRNNTQKENEETVNLNKQPETNQYGQPETNQYGQPETNQYGQPETNQYGQPETNQYGQPNNMNYQQNTMYGQANNYQTYNQNQVAEDNSFTLYLLLGIFQFLCCNQITAIITLIFAFMANDAFKRGDMNEHKKNAKYAKIATIIGLITGAIIGILLLLYFMLIGIGLAVSC